MLLQIFVNFYTVTAVKLFITTCFINISVTLSYHNDSLNISKFLG